MIVSYLDFDGTGIAPDEADTIPVVDTNAVLPATVSGQSLEPIAGRYAEIIQGRGGVELVQLPPSHTQDIRGTDPSCPSSVTPVEDVLSATILERNDHNNMIARYSCYQPGDRERIRPVTLGSPGTLEGDSHTDKSGRASDSWRSLPALARPEQGVKCRSARNELLWRETWAYRQERLSRKTPLPRRGSTLTPGDLPMPA